VDGLITQVTFLISRRGNTWVYCNHSILKCTFWQIFRPLLRRWGDQWVRWLPGTRTSDRLRRDGRVKNALPGSQSVQYSPQERIAKGDVRTDFKTSDRRFRRTFVSTVGSAPRSYPPDDGSQNSLMVLQPFNPYPSDSGRYTVWSIIVFIKGGVKGVFRFSHPCVQNTQSLFILSQIIDYDSEIYNISTELPSQNACEIFCRNIHGKSSTYGESILYIFISFLHK